MKTFATKVAGKRTSGRVATATSVAMIEDVGFYWIGRVLKMQTKIKSKWGISRQLVDLLNKPSTDGKNFEPNCNIMISLYWFSKLEVL